MATKNIFKNKYYKTRLSRNSIIKKLLIVFICLLLCITTFLCFYLYFKPLCPKSSMGDFVFPYHKTTEDGWNDLKNGKIVWACSWHSKENFIAGGIITVILSLFFGSVSFILTKHSWLMIFPSCSIAAVLFQFIQGAADKAVLNYIGYKGIRWLPPFEKGYYSASLPDFFIATTLYITLILVCVLWIKRVYCFFNNENNKKQKRKQLKTK